MATAQTIDTPSNAGVNWQIVEQLPEYPGGTEALLRFIADNLEYPESSRAIGIEGTVVVLVVITAEGRADRAEVIESVHPDLDKEALRVAKLTTDWSPARARGKPVEVYYQIPVEFRLE